VLLAPLPFAEPGNLVAFNFSERANPVDRQPLSVADYQDVAPQLTTFASVAAYHRQPLYDQRRSEPEQVRGIWGTGALLQTLGVPPILGRVFVASDDSAGGDNQVVLS
jgi:hypothetical protein